MLAGFARHAGADGAAVRHRAERVLSGTGHRRHPGRLGGRPERVVSGDGEAPATGGPTSSARDPAVEQPVVVRRHRSDQHHAQQRSRADQPEAARTASTRDATRDHPPPPADAGGDPGTERLHAAGAGHHRGRSGEPHAVSVHPRRPERRRVARVGAADAGEAPAAAGTSATRASDQQAARPARTARARS